MNRIILFLLLLTGITCTNASHAQIKRLDTTLKIGKAGYRIICNNRGTEKNMANISPIGFDNKVRDFSFEVKGKILRAEIDDLNRDGYPDVVLYFYSTDSLNRGNVVGISSDKNEGIKAIVFPDILDDQKLRVGYKGNDEFQLMEGILVRRFLVYTEGPDAHPTGKTRLIQYTVIPGEKEGILKFKVLRSYDYAK